jgi:hypothetical protein
MTAIVLAGVGTLLIGGLGVALGLKLMEQARAAVEATLPQRMVDYCGFVPAESERA